MRIVQIQFCEDFSSIYSMFFALQKLIGGTYLYIWKTNTLCNHPKIHHELSTCPQRKSLTIILIVTYNY